MAASDALEAKPATREGAVGRRMASSAYSEQLGVNRQRPNGPQTNVFAGESTLR
jgi:hypothetical protein